jgi:hypothetical protein
MEKKMKIEEKTTYKCKLCRKEVKLLKNHLRQTHNNMGIEIYFNETNDKKAYEEFNNNMSLIRKQRSPNCVEFYTSRGYSEEEALNMLEEHRSALPFRNLKNFRPNQVGYWMKKGFSEKESEQKVSLFQSNSKESLVEKYGEDGKVRYKQFMESLNKRKDTEIQGIQEQYNCDVNEAYEIFIEKRIFASPRREEYWIKEGYSKSEAKLKVSEWQMLCSPRTTAYWVDKGYSKTDSVNKVKEYQDNISINSLMVKHALTFEQAIDKQSDFIDKMLKTRIEKGFIINKLDKKEYDNYLSLTRRLTNMYYRLYKYIINPNDYNRTIYEYHLDHKVSIFEGFKNNIDYKIIASPYNLQMLSAKDNLNKGTMSSKKINNLIEEYNKNILKIKMVEII